MQRMSAMGLFGRNKKNKRNEDAEEKDYDDNVIEVKRTMDKKGKLLAGAAALLVVAGLVSAYVRYNAIRTFSDYDVVKSVDTSGDNVADYVVFAGNVLKVTKDGASYIDENGITKWDVSYAMKSPDTEVCGDYAIVTDLNGKSLYVFNTEGEVDRQTLNYDIANADIARQGVYCLVLVGGDSNYIKCYDKDGSPIYEHKVSIENGGYPVDIDISDDGQKLVVSYMKVSGTSTQTVLAMYNFDSVGQNENADRLMGSYTIEDSVHPVVKFTDNDTIVCYGDKDIRIYSMTEKPGEKAVIELDGDEMQGVFYSTSYIGYICLAPDGSGDKYNIRIYDTSGNLKAEAGYDDAYSAIYATDDEIMVVGDANCSIYRFNGSEKFRYLFDNNLINVVPDSNDNEYVVIFENSTQTITLK